MFKASQNKSKSSSDDSEPKVKQLSHLTRDDILTVLYKLRERGRYDEAEEISKQI